MKTPEWEEWNDTHVLRLANSHVTLEVTPALHVRIGNNRLFQTFKSLDEAKAEAVRLTRLALQDATYELDLLRMTGTGG